MPLPVLPVMTAASGTLGHDREDVCVPRQPQVFVIMLRRHLLRDNSNKRERMPR
jgi:hypothetical protein